MTFIVGFLLLLLAPECQAAPVLVAMGMSAATAATVSTVATVAATAIAAAGAIRQGQAAANAAEYNAELAEQNATASRQQAAANAAASDREARKRLGAIEATVGASGVAMEGSPLDILQESALNAELDRQNILYGGETRSRGYESTATLERYRGDEAETAGYMRAGSELIGGYGRAQSLTRVG